MKVLSKVLCLVIFSLSLTFEPSFSQVISTELKTKVENADLILTGKVINQKSQWNSDKSRINTLVTIRVEELLKGSESQSEIIIKHLGGEVGEVGEMYSHMPKFENKEEILVFLKKEKTGSNYKVISGEEGKISLINDPATGQKVTTSKVKINTLKTLIKSYIND